MATSSRRDPLPPALGSRRDGYRLSTLVIWTAVGPPLLLVAYLYAGLIGLFVHSIPIAAAVLAVLYVPLFAFLYFRRSHWRRQRRSGVRRQSTGR